MHFLAQGAIEKGLTNGHLFDGNSIWEYENGKYCTETIKKYFVELLYLSEIFRTLSLDLRGSHIPKFTHREFFKKQDEIVKKYEQICLCKYFTIQSIFNPK